jgi:group I intron endonuclease
MTERRELIRQYKETPAPMGVYRVRNIVNGKSFVGSARDVRGKLNGHLAQLKMQTHRNAELQRDWDAHGPDAFVFETLDLLEPANEPGYDPSDDLRVLEDLWLQRLRPFGENGYNQPGRRF